MQIGSYVLFGSFKKNDNGWCKFVLIIFKRYCGDTFLNLYVIFTWRRIFADKDILKTQKCGFGEKKLENEKISPYLDYLTFKK